MKFATALIAAALIAVPGAAAQSGVEWSGGYSSFDTGPVTLGAATVRGSYFPVRHLGGEVEVSTGLGSDSFGSGSVDLSASVAAFAVGRIPTGPRSEVFGRLGYASTSLSRSGPVPSGVSRNFDGVAVGAGGKFFLTDRFGVRGDLSKYNGSGNDATVWSLSAVFRY
jgi:outer membrane immunogenic protein